MSFFDKKFKKQNSGIQAVLDIGLSKICCAIVKKKRDDEEHHRVIGFGQLASKGVRASGIVNIENLEDSIINAVHTAEQTAGVTIQGVVVNIPSSLVSIYKIASSINVSGRPVDDQHLKKVLNVSKNDHIPLDQQVIHVFPQEYALDGATGITDPRGMIGETLTVYICVLTAPISFIKNLSACMGRCHLDIEAFVASGYAAGLAVLVEEEKKLGVTVIDIGGGGTTIASFLDDRLIDVAAIPIGGMHITNDIARVLATPIAQAERIKNLYGTLLLVSEDEREMIVIPQLGESLNTLQNNNVSKFYLSEIIRSRVEELFHFVKDYIQANDVDPVVYQRIVITGGTSQLSGMRECATDILGAQIRLGAPYDVLGASDVVQTPIFSVCAGLLAFAQDSESKNNVFVQKKEGPFSKITGWIRDNF